MNVMRLLVLLILLCLVFWATNTLTAAFGLPGPVVAVIKVLLVVFAVLYLLGAAGLPTP